MYRYLLVAILFSACQSKTSELQNSADSVEPTGLIDATDEFYSTGDLDVARVTVQLNDTSMFDLIDRESAITIFPDTLWINEQQQDEEVWLSIVDDHNYYESIALDTLGDLGIPVLNSNYNTGKRYLKFQLPQDSIYVIDRSRLRGAWGLILFNGTERPSWWSGAMFTDDLEKVYKRQAK